MKRVLLITGSPGIGKTTVLKKAVDFLKGRGFSVGGMISREIRENGTRVGFELIDLLSEKCGWLAHIEHKTGPKVGKYHVNLKDLESIGVRAISEALVDCDIVAIDEVGPMELFSEKFKEAVRKALISPKVIIAVIHWNAKDELINFARDMDDAEILTVTVENREQLSQALGEKVVASLCRNKKSSPS